MSRLEDDAPPPFDEGGPPASRRRTRGAGVDRSIAQAGALGAAAVVVSVLAVGAVHLPVLLIVSALAFAALAMVLRRQAQGAEGIVLPLPALIGAALVAYTLLQIVPLPAGLLKVLAPTAADIWERSLFPLGEGGPRWASLSLDPGATAVEALKWATYGAVFVTAAAVSARYGASWGLLAVFGAAVLAALATVGHGLADATKLWGLYQPAFPAPAWHVGPLLNPNNLAGYLNLGAIVGLGLMLGDRPHVPRAAIAVGVTLIVGIELTAASRGGTGALLVGVTALALLTRRRGGHGRSRGMSTFLLLAVVAGGGLLAVLGATDKTWAELYDKDLSKLSMITWARPMLRDHPFFGVGRGAFESVFPVYRTAVPGNYVFTHPENLLAQWATEWGLPVTVAALGALAWAFTPRRMGATRSAVAAGGLCGVGSLVLQNLFDLGLEIPAVSVAVAAVLGSLWGDRHRARANEAWRRPGPLGERGEILATAAPVIVAVLLGGLALAKGRDDVDADKRAAREAVEAAKGGDPAPARGLLREAMLRHPAEPYLPLLGAVLAFETRSESPVPWLQRSLERGRVNGNAHLLLSEVLASRGARKQALLELRLAVGDDPVLGTRAAALASRWTRDYDELVTAVPEGKAGGAFFSQLATVLHAGAGASPAAAELARRCDRQAIARDPDLVEPRFREATARIDALKPNAKDAARICPDRAACRKEVEAHAAAIARAVPQSELPPALRARLLLAEDRAEEAVRLLTLACEQLSEPAPCLYERTAAAARVKGPTEIDAASRALLARACATAAGCATASAWLAGLRAERGDTQTALSLLVRAAHEDPSAEGRWLEVATAASRAGQHAQALEALEKVSRLRGGADAALAKRIEEARVQVFGRLGPQP